jgi:hypothetical protein
MGYWQDTTVEVTYKGKTTRVAKEDAHLYAEKVTPEKKVKQKKEE